MNGIIFFKSADLEAIDRFYREKLKCELWLDQDSCRIYKAGNMLLGFCQHLKVDTQCQAIITFVFEKRSQVVKSFNILKDSAQSKPSYNDKFSIYNFFAKDPEGRTLEFQTFENKEGK